MATILTGANDTDPLSTPPGFIASPSASNGRLVDVEAAFIQSQMHAVYPSPGPAFLMPMHGPGVTGS